MERTAFVALVLGAVAIVVLLPVIPGHDVPQHLAYVRLLATWPSPALADVYAAPDVSNVYATTYRLLAPLARVTSAETAMRVALVAYAVLLPLGVRRLARALWEDTSATLLAPLAVFHPVLCMGLLPFTLALPPLTFAVAEGALFLRRGTSMHLVAATALAALTAALHGFAAAALLLFAALVVVMRRDARTVLWLGGTGLGLAVASRALGSVASLPPGLGAELARNVRIWGLYDGVVGTFRISFTHPLEKLNQIAANVLGPFPWRFKLILGLGLLAILLTARRTKAEALPGIRPALVAFAVLAALAPAALQVPDDLSLLDFRLLTTAFVLALAAVPPLAFGRGRLVLVTAAFLAVWARQLGGAAEEVMRTVRLVDRLDPAARVLALPMHDASAWLDERNAVLHYAAVHHTARNAGVTSLFWARFSPRLPVGYRPGHEPPHPFDWAPWELEDAQLDAYTHVLVRWPHDDDEPRLHELARRVRELERLRVVACDDDCCLYDVARPEIDAPLTRK